MIYIYIIQYDSYSVCNNDNDNNEEEGEEGERRRRRREGERYNKRRRKMIRWRDMGRGQGIMTK